MGNRASQQPLVACKSTEIVDAKTMGKGKAMTDTISVLSAELGLPAWLPHPVHNYLAHAVAGRSIRSLARSSGQHASTVLRQVRQIEADRDDPLVDLALQRLDRVVARSCLPPEEKVKTMNQLLYSETRPNQAVSQARIEKEGARILRRLCESGATLAVATNMEKALVVRELEGDVTTRSAVVDRDIAEAMALLHWITATARKGRIARYKITAAGRAALRDMVERTGNMAGAGFAEAPAIFRTKIAAPSHSDLSEYSSHPPYQESPLTGLSRRRMKNGERFLPESLLRAGERLREDYELALMLPGPTTDWQAALCAQTPPPEVSNGPGAEAARDRVIYALQTLGPGLGDIALRCCCMLEGLEAVEKKMSWSARSGKIVLRIALQRLQHHYEETHGRLGPMIG